MYEAVIFPSDCSQPSLPLERFHCFTRIALLFYVMSRALDTDTASSVETGNPQQVYTDIVAALSQSTSELLEIEFLGKSHPLPAGTNVLVDGNSIAIPKSKLVQAFVLARHLLFENLDDFQNARDQDIRNATAVILLMDPEHLTAANTRKRLIKKCQETRSSDLEKQLKREMLWVNSMLTSRSHRITKSPTLWAHRRWVLEVCQSIKMPYNIHEDLCSVILTSAERHPRNYYAWLHVRWLLQSSLRGRNDTKQPGMDNDQFLSTILEWCLRNPGDTAGFSFLLFCLSHLSEEKQWRIEAKSDICRKVLGLAHSFQWTHEAVWVFLRTLVASGEIAEDDRALFFKNIEAIRGSQAAGSQAQRVLRAARDWCNQYEKGMA